MINKLKQNRAFSLVETLVAISILLVTITAPLTIASKSLQSNFLAHEQYTATMLAQEGIEAVVSLHRHSQITAVRNSTDTAWGWYDALPSECKDVGQGCPIDMRGTGGQPAVAGSNDCSTILTSPNICRIWDDTISTGDRARFNHSGNGLETPYSRSIKVIDVGSASTPPTQQVLVESTVLWDTPHVDGGIATVTLRSTLFNTATTTIN